MISAKILTAVADVVTTWHPSVARCHHSHSETTGSELESYCAQSVQTGERVVVHTKWCWFWPVMWRDRVRQSQPQLPTGRLPGCVNGNKLDNRTNDPKRHGPFSVLIAASLSLLPHTAMALSIEEVLNTGKFSIFSAALQKSGLLDRMSSEDSVTLFLISDKALRDEGSAFLLGTVYMTKGSQRSLLNLMSYHVSFGAPLLPDEILREIKLGMIKGACLPVWKSGGGIRVGPEAVVTDVKHVDNGVVLRH